jgi:uncharacterized protein YkwD
VRRPTAAVLTLTCMGISVGAAALAGPAVHAGTPSSGGASAVSAQHSAATVADDVTAMRTSPRARYQRRAFATTNNRRADHGLTELRKADCVQRYAVRQAKRMAAQENMYHQQLGPILTECGLGAVGENVAYGFRTGRLVVNQGWMKSAGHRANILNPVYRLMGVGARKGDDGVWYVAQVFGTGL